MAVRRLIEPAVRGETDLYRRILKEAQERSIPITRLGAGDTINIDQNVRLYVLHPRAPQDSTGNLNNVSLVVKLVYGSNGLLLLGDAEREVEATLIRRFSPMLRADVLKVAHHGSSTSSTFELLNAVRPSVALVSVGRKNKFHHPSSAVLDRFHQMGIVVYRTDRAGAIVLQSTGETFALVDWRQ
jgi:competence protein ComEC